MGLLFFILRRVPLSWARAFLRFVMSIVYALGIRRRIALENLRLAFPEKSERERRAIARASYLHLGTVAADFLRGPFLSDQELFDLVDEGDWAKAEPFLKEGKGLIACSAHLGNFELLGVYSARRKVPLTALTRPLKGAANAAWVRLRTLAKVNEIHKGMENLVSTVKGGGTLAILIDQNMLPKRAVFVPFFGKLAATTPAPAVVAERSGRPVVLALLLRRPDGCYRLAIEGPFHFERRAAHGHDDVLAFTAMLNERLERFVREHPEQWFWLHRRWKTRPPEESVSGKPAEVDAAGSNVGVG